MFGTVGTLFRYSSLCAALVLAGCTGDTGAARRADNPLTAEQCDFFERSGRVTICHATGSRTNPYTLIRIATSACVNAHTAHAGDYVSTDGTCGPGACLPVGGPVDATIGCCPGLVVVASICDVDECRTNNGGCDALTTCTNTLGSRTCGVCPSGYTGTGSTHCINIDDCSPNPCQNGSTCTDGVNSHTCACQPGYSGANCEVNIDNCSPDPCLNGGTCVDGVASYTCTCAGGYTGTNCEIPPVSACASNPCQNGGTCAPSGTTYTCTCASGYTGTNCESSACPSPPGLSMIHVSGTMAKSCHHGTDPWVNVHACVQFAPSGWRSIADHSGSVGGVHSFYDFYQYGNITAVLDGVRFDFPNSTSGTFSNQFYDAYNGTTSGDFVTLYYAVPGSYLFVSFGGTLPTVGGWLDENYQVVTGQHPTGTGGEGIGTPDGCVYQGISDGTPGAHGGNWGDLSAGNGPCECP